MGWVSVFGLRSDRVGWVWFGWDEVGLGELSMQDVVVHGLQSVDCLGVGWVGMKWDDMA